MPNSDQTLRPLLLAIISSVGRKTTNPAIEWDEHNAIYSILVDPNDQGRFIGKLGGVFWAINTVFWYAGLHKIGRHAKVALREPDHRVDQIPIPFKPNKNWDSGKIKTLIKEIVSSVSDESSYQINRIDEARVAIDVRLPEGMKEKCEEPNLSEAIDILLSAATRASGCSATITVGWIRKAAA